MKEGLAKQVKAARGRRVARGVGTERTERLNTEVLARFKVAVKQQAALRRCSERAIVEAALEAFFDPAAQDNRDAMISRRLSRIDARMKSLEQDLLILTEWVVEDTTIRLGYLPQLTSEEERRQYNVLAKQRRTLVLNRVVENLQAGMTLHAELPSEFVMRTAEPVGGKDTKEDGSDTRSTSTE